MSTKTNTKRIYLASPYSDVSSLVMQNRFNSVCRKAAELMLEGFIVFSPIAHSHSIAQHMPEDKICDFNFWIKQDLDYLAYWATALYVLCLPDWASSKGVMKEISIAMEYGISIHFLNVEE